MGKHRRNTGRHRKKNAPADQTAGVISIVLAAGALILVVRWLRAG